MYIDIASHAAQNVYIELASGWPDSGIVSSLGRAGAAEVLAGRANITLVFGVENELGTAESAVVMLGFIPYRRILAQKASCCGSRAWAAQRSTEGGHRIMAGPVVASIEEPSDVTSPGTFQ
jgi:hypothetical protein